MNDIRDILHINIQSPYWDEAYASALAEPDVPEWLTENYIDTLYTKYGLLPKTHETVLKALPFVQNEPALCLLAKTLYHILATKKGFKAAFTEFELPKAPEGVQNTIGYDCVAIFPVLAHLLPSWNELKARGIEDDVLTASLFWADSLFYQCTEKAGKPCFDEGFFKSYGVAIYLNHLIIGRLRFEIHENSERPARIFQNANGEYCVLMENTTLHRSGHILGAYGCMDEDGAYAADFKETETTYEGYAVDQNTGLAQNARTVLSKTDWTPVYQSGYTAIKVHIPYGGKLDKENCAASYARAKEIFKRCFPEYDFKCFLICCWMLSPVLRELLKPESNILAFQEGFTLIPAKSGATDAFLYVFGIETSSVSDIDLEKLPENNSLQRGIKQNALQGKYIHQFHGYKPF